MEKKPRSYRRLDKSDRVAIENGLDKRKCIPARPDESEIRPARAGGAMPETQPNAPPGIFGTESAWQNEGRAHRRPSR